LRKHGGIRESVDRRRSSIRLLAEEGASSASSEFFRELSLLDARLSARERRSQQTKKQRQATGMKYEPVR